MAKVATFNCLQVAAALHRLLVRVARKHEALTQLLKRTRRLLPQGSPLDPSHLKLRPLVLRSLERNLAAKK